MFGGWGFWGELRGLWGVLRGLWGLLEGGWYQGIWGVEGFCGGGLKGVRGFQGC